MPYNSVDELPQTVKDKIKSPKKRRQWMHVWNSEYALHSDESRAFASAWSTVEKRVNNMSDFNIFLPLAKVEKTADGGCLVSGYASTPSLDLDGEIISLDAVKKALPGYWEWRNIREMHQPSAVGVAKEANVDETGLFLTSKIIDPIAVEKCLNQVYKGYSIGGKKLAKKGNTITEIELVEVSIVDRPANPDCRISVAKRAKDVDENTGGILLKVGKADAKSKAIRKMAEAVEALTKAIPEPPAAHDGFSLPAKTPCKKHDKIDCEECAKEMAYSARVEKREYSAEQRKDYAARGIALPDGSFPIPDVAALSDAIHAFGRSGDKPAAKKHIIRRAKALGRSDMIPESWRGGEKKDKEKEAKKAAKAAARALSSAKSLPLKLKKTKEGRRPPRAEVSLELRKFADTSLDLSSLSLKSEGSGEKESGINSLTKGLLALDRGELDFEAIFDEDIAMSGDALDKVILDAVKRATTPSRAKRMEMARENVKRANKVRKAARSAIEEAYKMHKAAYVAKAARAKKNDNDADDFDHANAMEKLSRAYTEINKMGAFLKAAREQINKAARVGQRGQEVADGVSGTYEVPVGVKDLSQSTLTEGSVPVPPGDGSEYPRKFAKNGQVPVEVAELAVKNAKLEARLEALSAVPSGNRPYAFDVTKVAGATGAAASGDPVFDAITKSKVDTRAFQLDEENPLRKTATATVVGTYLMDGGKSVFDPAFRGAAGARA